MSPVAKTILDQIGGVGNLCRMTGAKQIVYSDNSVRFKVGRNAKRVTHVSIELNGRDLYDVAFFNIRGTKVKKITGVCDCFADMLQDVFEAETGLYLTFAPRR